jgi:hypothetical protein
MPTLSAAVVEGERATFVEAIVRADQPHRVRLEPCFRGVIWPPRTEGRPAIGWDEHGLTTTVGVGSTAVGFATPASFDGTPVSIVRSEPLSDDLPVGVTAWLDRIEGRLDAAERLAEAPDLRAAAEAVASVGGLAAVERLAGKLARDRRLAARLSIVPSQIQTRLEGVEIPTTEFARLAARPSETE